MSEAKCEVCGEPMPPGEEMFKYHGYSGPCPKGPLEPTDEGQVVLSGKMAREEVRVKLLREALSWAVGFIRCHHPKVAEEYPDFRNAESLVAETGGDLFTGEFTLTRYRAEQAEEERDRLKAALEMLAQVRHVSGNAQGHMRSQLRTIDAALAGADLRRMDVVEAVAAGTWRAAK
jgi:hypothetical protein